MTIPFRSLLLALAVSFSVAAQEKSAPLSPGRDGLNGPQAAGTRARTTWMADNGNGTFTNPLFYDEFSDPDVIRVGDDYYLTGTTMHAMPGLPILHSRDLVNWDFVGYALAELDLGPAYRLQGGDIYGQGIWAPCFRYHAGTFYIFANVNGRKTQLFRATNPAGPWTHTELGSSLHDLSVLFDDDGRIYVVWDYNEIKFAQLKSDLTDIIPETKRVLIPAGSGMGEGSHFYHLNGHYYIFSANYDPMCYEVVARADRPEGPYEVTTTSALESFGIGTGWRLKGLGRDAGLQLISPRPDEVGSLAMHQGGIVSTASGEWWGLSMMDHNSVGRLTCLSPITWRDGWPYFGLPGNLTRTPLTWIKPGTGHDDPPHAPYEHSDDFAGPALKPVWQWNHVPDNAHWSLSERPGALRLHALGAPDFWHARDSLTQRAVGPESTATVELDASGMKAGDVAGLALLNLPYAWIGLRRGESGLALSWFDQTRGATRARALAGTRAWLRVHCNFDIEQAQFSVSEDGVTFQPFGDPLTMVFQLKTFQGVRFSLFNFNEKGAEGGFVDFSHFSVDEPRANGRGRPIPIGHSIALTSLADGRVLAVWNGHLRALPVPLSDPAAGRFRVRDRGRGRVALEAENGAGFVTVTGAGEAGDVRLVGNDAGTAATFQWEQMESGDIMLLSLVTDRMVAVDPLANGLMNAATRGASPDRRNGASFTWTDASAP
ncbi:MAG TPA: glycoside hydrolase 43 family protein [Candidatus Didemnitutus sp.]|nr:glycoside hydrolase 43 family protein [Candidatus Didemnitutus sp.]